MGVHPSGTTTGTLTHVGDYLAWTVSVAKPGNFTVTTNAATPANLHDHRSTAGRSAPAPGPAPLTTGLHGIRVRNLSAAGTSVSQLIVTE